MGQDIETERKQLGCKRSLGEGDGGLITHKCPAELKLMMELIGPLYNLEPGLKSNRQLFPGLKELGRGCTIPPT